jgi:septum formation protein
LKLYTENEHVILASSSQTRIGYLKKKFRKAIAVKHKVDEMEIKKKNKHLSFEDLVKLLAKRKAQSIMEDYPEGIIIGSDQLLVCDGKLFNKSKSISEARSNLNKLKGKKHTLISSTYAIKNQKPYFEETKEAEILFKNVSQISIEEYLMEKKKEVLMSVGSYRIEDNKKYNFLKIVRGDHETIIGFPLINLKKKFMEDAK